MGFCSRGGKPQLPAPQMSVSHRVLSRTGRSVRRAGSSAPTPAQWAPLGLRLSTLRPHKPPAGEPAPGMAGQLPGSPSPLLARDRQGQREASPINTFHWGCFLVTHLPAFLQQTSLNSCVPPSSRRDVLAGGGQVVPRWVLHQGCPRRPAQEAQVWDVCLQAFVIKEIAVSQGNSSPDEQ